MIKVLPAAGLMALLLLAGCKTGFNRTTQNNSTDPNAPECATEASNPNLQEESRTLFKMLANLTCSKSTHDGYIMGQHTGSGNQIALENSANSYKALIEDVKTKTGHTPGLVSLEYEFDNRYTLDQLKSANTKLKDHWKKGGLVTISWTPQSPWMSQDDASLVLYSQAGNVNLADLLDDSKSVHRVWRQRLDVIANALKDLHDAGVPVLWRPLPEMNRNIYWWGTRASHQEGNTSDASLYTDLWQDMYDYFKEKGLHNLLWVYSPGASFTGTNVGLAGQKATWAYPGKDYVDIVAGITRNDSLNIPDYEDLIALKHPFGMAEYTPTPTEIGGQQVSKEESFDASWYSDRLNGSYPATAFWVSWNSYSVQIPNNTDESDDDFIDVFSYMALIDSANLKKLTDRSHILSVERLLEHKLRSTD